MIIQVSKTSAMLATPEVQRLPVQQILWCLMFFTIRLAQGLGSCNVSVSVSSRSRPERSRAVHIPGSFSATSGGPLSASWRSFRSWVILSIRQVSPHKQVSGCSVKKRVSVFRFLHKKQELNVFLQTFCICFCIVFAFYLYTVDCYIILCFYKNLDTSEIVRKY